MSTCGAVAGASEVWINGDFALDARLEIKCHEVVLVATGFEDSQWQRSEFGCCLCTERGFSVDTKGRRCRRCRHTPAG